MHGNPLLLYILTMKDQKEKSEKPPRPFLDAIFLFLVMEDLFSSLWVLFRKYCTICNSNLGVSIGGDERKLLPVLASLPFSSELFLLHQNILFFFSFHISQVTKKKNLLSGSSTYRTIQDDSQGVFVTLDGLYVHDSEPSQPWEEGRSLQDEKLTPPSSLETGKLQLLIPHSPSGPP